MDVDTRDSDYFAISTKWKAAERAQWETTFWVSHNTESFENQYYGCVIAGFDSVGNVVNKPDHGTLDWVKICEKSAKVITFIDLAGHERYLKTTVFGMTGHAPDFGMLMVNGICEWQITMC